MLKIKLLNLDRRPDRLSKVTQELNSHNITTFDRFPAIDGTKLVPDNNLTKIFSKNTFNYRKGVMGCTLSHYLIWKELIYSPYDYYLVLEDDITLTPNFHTILNSLPLHQTTYPLIYLGYSTDPRNQPPFSTTPPIIKPLINKTDIWGGTFAYIIHKNCAKLFISDIDTNGIQKPIDTYMLSHPNIYELTPHPVKSQVMVIWNRADTDIHYDVLSIFDNYIYFQELDSPGGTVRTVGKQLVPNLINLANKTPACVAINSFGEIKTEIVAPKDFKPFTQDHVKKDGIYIKIVKTEEYDFYPRLDSEGYNIKVLPNVNINSLKNIVKTIPNCVGFNTNGELKYNIRDPKEFRLIGDKKYKDINKMEGLYVLKKGIRVSIDSGTKHINISE